MSTMMTKAVISLYNTPSGLFIWWDQFPNQISRELTSLGIDHITFYKAYTENTTYLQSEQRIATNEDLNSVRWLMSTLLPLSKQYKQVIIHTHSHYPSMKLWVLMLLAWNTEWHITEHRIGSTKASLLPRLYRSLMRRIGLYPKHVIGVSNRVMKRCIALYGKRNVQTIYNGIDIDRFSRSTPLLMPAVGGTSSMLRALYVGRMDSQKGVYALVHAFQLINRERIIATLTMVGDGQELDGLKKFSNENNLNSIIHFSGYHSDVKPFYEVHDIIVIPTQIEEALSLVAVEARSMGVPAIYSERGGLPEVFFDNGAGIGIPEPTPEQIANAVSKVALDRGLYRDLVMRTRLNIEKFDIATMATNYVAHYVKTFS